MDVVVIPHEPVWASVTKGILLTLFGLVTLAWPGVTLVSLVWLIAVYILIAGIVDIVSGVLAVGHGYWWAKLLLGIAEVAVGVYLIQHPHETLHLFLLIIGFFFLIRGFAEIILAFTPGLKGTGRLFFGFVGFLSLVLGFYLLRYPVSSALAFLWVLGLFALIGGPLTIAAALAQDNE